jgi:transcriptional regulator with XRE-family HTH domain
MQVALRIAEAVRAQRRRRGWSLDELAARSGVSRAMISKIERKASTPTAVLLARLADALGVSLNALMFDPDTTANHASTTSTVNDQALWRDPASGYTRRMVSAARGTGDVEIVAIELPAGARVRFEASASHRIDGRVLLLQGRLQITLAAEVLTLEPGDCARVALHAAHELHNPGNDDARYLVVTRRLAPLRRVEPSSRS